MSRVYIPETSPTPHIGRRVTLAIFDAMAGCLALACFTLAGAGVACLSLPFIR